MTHHNHDGDDDDVDENSVEEYYNEIKKKIK